MKNSFAALAALAAAGSMTAMTPSAAHANIFGPAEVKRWNMCDWERIPEDALERISRRSDYEDILRRMFDFCPDAALGLTDRPTATLTDNDESDDQRGREPDDDTSEPEGEEPGDKEPEDDTPDNEPPETEDPGGDGPEVPDFGLPG